MFQVKPLHPSLGAEISGIDLSKRVDEVTRHALSRALAEHLALVFHDQSLTPAQYLTASEVFGPPMRQHYSQHLMPEFPDIGLVWHRNGQRPAERWHTDHTNRERPPAELAIEEDAQRHRPAGHQQGLRQGVASAFGRRRVAEYPLTTGRR